MTVGVLLSFSATSSASSASLHLCSYVLLDWEKQEDTVITAHLDFNEGQINHKWLNVFHLIYMNMQETTPYL